MACPLPNNTILTPDMLTAKWNAAVVAAGVERPFTAVATKPIVVNFTLWYGLQLYNKKRFIVFEIRLCLSCGNKC